MDRDPITNQAKWDYYLSDSSLIAPFATPYPTSKELAVTRIWQRSSGISSPKSSCGPTTGAMIVNYYKSKGYTIRGSSYYVGGNSGLVNHLYSEMNSGIFGTSLSDFAGGLFDHLRHDGKSTIWRGLAYDDATNHYIEYKDAIYTDRPVAIRYNFFVSSDSYVNYHFVAGIAYKEQNGTNYFGIKDPDNGETTTETRYLSWDSQAKNFAMHLTIPQ